MGMSVCLVCNEAGNFLVCPNCGVKGNVLFDEDGDGIYEEITGEEE